MRHGTYHLRTAATTIGLAAKCTAKWRTIPPTCIRKTLRSFTMKANPETVCVFVCLCVRAYWNLHIGSTPRSIAVTIHSEHMHPHTNTHTRTHTHTNRHTHYWTHTYTLTHITSLSLFHTHTGERSVPHLVNMEEPVGLAVDPKTQTFQNIYATNIWISVRQ